MRGNKIIKAYLNAPKGLGNAHDRRRADTYICIIAFVYTLWMQNYLDAIIGQRQKRKQMHSLVWKPTPPPSCTPFSFNWQFSLAMPAHKYTRN